MSYNFITQIIYNVITFFTRKKAIKKETLIDENNFIIRQPKAGLIVLIIIALSCFSLMVLGFVIDEWLISLFLLLGSLLFAFFIVLWFKSKIIVKGNQITSMSKFGRKKEYTFDYITEVKCGVVLTGYQEFEPYIEGYHEKERLFVIDADNPGFYVLRSLLEKKGVPFVDKEN